MPQVSLQPPGFAPGLGGGRPADQHAKRATGLELRLEHDTAPALASRDHRPGVAGEGDQCRQVPRLVDQRAPGLVVRDEGFGDPGKQPYTRHAYPAPHAELASPDLAPYRAAITRLLAAHEPYPAMVLNRCYTVLLANEACAVLFGPGMTGSNFVTDALANPAIAQTIVNWPEVAWARLDRLRENAKRTPFDPGLQALIGRAETALAGVPRPQPAEAGLLVCAWFRVGGGIVRTIALTARFDHAADVTLDELRAELIYPLDEQADRFFRGGDGGGTGG